jgi:hypothetical protein
MFTIKPLALLLKITGKNAKLARPVGFSFGTKVNVEKNRA